MNVRVVLFYSGYISSSVEYAETIQNEIEEHGLRVETVIVEQNWPLWRRIGLKTVPSFVFFYNERPVANLVGRVDIDRVVSEHNRISSQYMADRLCVDLSEWNSPNSSLSETANLDYVVRASSGVHRYERWNEELISGSSQTEGWTSSSGTHGRPFVVLDLRGPCNVSALHVLPRVRHDGVPSWKSFPAEFHVFGATERDGEWRSLSHYRATCESDMPDSLLIPVENEDSIRELKLEVVASYDMGGKSFPSVASVLVMGRRLSSLVDMNRKSLKEFDIFNKKQFFKSGLYAFDDIRVELLNLSVGQTVPRCWSTRPRLLFVIEGRVSIDTEDQRADFAAGDFFLSDPHTSFAIIGQAPLSKCLAIFNADDLESVWEDRQ